MSVNVPDEYYWEDFTKEEKEEMKQLVYKYFPDSTLDTDGTFTSGIAEVYRVLLVGVIDSVTRPPDPAHRPSPVKINSKIMFGILLFAAGLGALVFISLGLLLGWK